MKLYKNIFVSLLSAVITMMAVYGGYTIYAGDYPFNKKPMGFDAAFNAYHKEMNKYFNGKIEKLNTLLDQPNFWEKPDFKAPPLNTDPTKPDFEKIKEACETNVSTYCVSMGALDRYIEYVKVLDNIVGTLATDYADTSATAFTQTAKNLIRDTQKRNDRLKAEYESARKVMEATVAAYHEYRLAYPMHKRYEDVMKELIKYKLALKDIRKQAMEFPVKFIDASTTKCE